MTGVVAAQYATALAGLLVLLVWAQFARRGRNALGPAPDGPLPNTALAVFVAVPAWFLSTIVLGAVAQAAGLTGPGLATAAGLVHVAIALALLPMVRRGAPVPRISSRRLVLAGLVAGVVTFGVVGLAGEAVKLGYSAAGVAPPEQDVVEIARRSSGGEWAAMVVTSLVLAPFGEEIFWRGALLPALTRSMSIPAAVVVQGFAFGAVHFVFGAPVAAWPLAFPLGLVGVLAGVLYVRTASLPAAIVLHATFNGINLLFLRLS